MAERNRKFFTGNRQGTAYAVILAAILLAGALLAAPALGETAGADRGITEISTTQFAAGPVTLSVMITGGPAGQEPDIRFFPFDAEKGLYTTGDGEAAGDRAEIISRTEDGTVYTAALKEAGKYTLNGIPFYVISPENEKPAALAEEIRAAADQAEGKSEKATAQKLYEWLLKRVKSVIPEDRPELAEACKDPFNCLLTGYALPETYAELYRMLLRTAKIQSIPVSGTVSEAEHGWVLCRLDGQWVHADPAMDDVKDKAGKKYFAPAEKQFGKDHILSDASERFISEWINATPLDLCLADRRADQERLNVKSEKEAPFQTFFIIDGKPYSLGPSEPVTIRCYNNYQAWPEEIPEWMTPDMLRFCFVCEYVAWDSEYKSFLEGDWLRTSQEIPEGAVEVLDYAADGSSITLRFLLPGKYKLNGADGAIYVLDPEDEEQAAVAKRLDEALEACRRDTEKETARALHDWEKAQVRYDHGAYQKFMRDYYDGSLESNQDPFNALITGCSVCGGYSNLYQLLLESAGIRCFYVRGRTGVSEKTAHAWNMHRLDGEWSFTDVTWDDDGGGTTYFALPYEKIEKKHHAMGSYEWFLDIWVLPKAYDGLLSRFYRDYGPKDGVPETLKVLPATAKEYGFPSSAPNFYNVRFTVDGEYVTILNPGRAITCMQWLRMNKRGMKLDGIGYDYGISRFPCTIVLPYSFHAYIMRLTLLDYNVEKVPTNKASVRQVIEMTVDWETEYSEYTYQVPMKKNDIKGYGTGSYRIFTYDMNLKKTASGWHLANDTETVEVQAYFDSEGNTVRYSVSKAPAGGDASFWELDADGTVIRLGYETDKEVCCLEDLTDVYLQNRYLQFRKHIQTRYEKFLSLEEPPEEGIRLYSLSRTEDEKYAGYIVIATRDPLFRWDALGNMEFNPDARDLNGDPIDFGDFNPDLMMCERLQIAGK